jgi:hypothetical protein
MTTESIRACVSALIERAITAFPDASIYVDIEAIENRIYAVVCIFNKALSEIHGIQLQPRIRVELGVRDLYIQQWRSWHGPEHVVANFDHEVISFRALGLL